jgi:hypothetical protein
LIDIDVLPKIESEIEWNKQSPSPSVSTTT